MAGNNVKFLKGTYAGYQALATNGKGYDSNYLYITTDEGGIYLGDKRLGDYILVDNVAALENEATVKSTGALYYAKQENVLARWDGTNWVQINAAGLTKVEVTGSGDYIANVSVSTSANGTARALQITKGSLANNSVISGMEKRLGDAETLLNTLSGGSGTGSIQDQIDASIAPVEAKANKAQEDATSAINTNTQQQTAIEDNTRRIGLAETAISNEVSARETAISNLVNSASDGYNTLKDLEDKVKAADAKAQGAVDKNTTQDGLISGLDTRVGANETAISNEVSARETAINNLVNNASDGYKTLKDLEDKVKAADAKAQGAVDTNAQQATAISGHETRIGAAESAITILNGNDQQEGSVDYKIAQEVAKILNDNDDSDIDTLNEIAAWITNDTTGAAKMNADISALKNTVNNDHTGRIGQAETDIETLEGDLADEIEAREKAITDLVDGASADYQTLGKIETKVKAAADAASTNSGKITALEGRVGTNETGIADNKVAIEKEVTDREAAITGLVNGASDGYNTLKDLEDKVKAAASTGSTNSGKITALEGRVGTNETNIANNDAAIKKEVSDREAAITALIGDAGTDYNTLGKLEDKIQAVEVIANGAVSVNNSQETRIAAVESILEWGTF